MKYRILLVEDDEMMVEILKRNLEKWGYLARGITDFQNVMDEFQSFEPQLVLMDISLPFYNGLLVRGNPESESGAGDFSVLLRR